MRRVNRFGLAALLLLLASPARADTASGFQWLSSQAQSNGSISSNIAYEHRSTFEAIRALRAHGHESQTAAALGFLNSETDSSTPFLTRRIIANVEAGIPVPESVAELLTHQNSDGSFGDGQNHNGSALDTAFALEALAIAGQYQTQAVGNALLYLTGQQQPDGSWNCGECVSNNYVTALAMRAVWLHRNAYPVSGAVSKAQSYLLSQRTAAGLWSETYQTALSLTAILPNLADRSPVQNSVDALRAQQLANGSFDDDTYVTALALRALGFYEDRFGSGAAGAESGSVEGYVRRADTSAPISDATLTVPSGAGLTAHTNADGYFLMSGLPAGDHTLEASKTGYFPLGKVVRVTAGSITSGDIALSADDGGPPPSTLTLHGSVVDSVSNAPIAGASATLAASGETQTSDSEGRFTFTGLSELTVSVSISASDHESRIFQVTASGYGEVAATFALPPGGGSDTATSSILQGQVLDADTGSVISDANVLIVTTALSATSDTSGAFRISNIQTLEFDANVSAPGYRSRDYGIQLTRHGAYELNAQLEPLPASAFQILSLVPIQTGTGANAIQTFAARVASSSSEPQSALIIGEIFDAAGRSVGKTTPYVPGTVILGSEIPFPPQATLDLVVPWNPTQLPPGSYRLALRIVQPGSINGQRPDGVVLNEAQTWASVETSQSIAGEFGFEPPLVQAGANESVRLSALVLNSGNVPLMGQLLTMTIRNPANGQVLHQAQATADMLEVGQNTLLEFGSWLPTEAGDLPATIASSSPDVQSQVAGVSPAPAAASARPSMAWLLPQANFYFFHGGSHQLLRFPPQNSGKGDHGAKTRLAKAPLEQAYKFGMALGSFRERLLGQLSLQASALERTTERHRHRATLADHAGRVGRIGLSFHKL